MRTVRHAFLPLLALLSLTGARSLSSPQEKAPVPNVAERNRAKKAIRRAFKEEFAKTRDFERLRLAVQLIRDGIKTKDNPATRYVLFSEAMDLGAKIGDVGVCVHAIEQMAVHFDLDALDLKMKTFRKAGRSVSQPADQRKLLSAYLIVGAGAVRDDRFTLAGKAYAQAEKLAKKLKDKELIARIKDKKKAASSRLNELEEVEAARKKLDENPEDPDANLSVGRYLCRVKDDWSGGLPMLAKGADPALKELAQKDLSDPQEPEARTELADAWWDLVQTHPHEFVEPARRRSGHWYKKAFPDLAGEAQARVWKRLSALSVGFDLLGEDWWLGKSVEHTKDEIIIDSAKSNYDVLSARFREPYVPGTKFEATFTIDRIDLGEAFLVGIQLHLGSVEEMEGATLFGWGIEDNQADLSVWTSVERRWKEIADLDISSPPTLSTPYRLRLETRETSYRLSLHDAEGELLHELKKDRAMPEEFYVGVRAQHGKIRLTRFVMFLP